MTKRSKLPHGRPPWEWTAERDEELLDLLESGSTLWDIHRDKLLVTRRRVLGEDDAGHLVTKWEYGCPSRAVLAGRVKYLRRVTR